MIPMYHIPSQPLYHNSVYQESSLYCELKNHTPISADYNNFAPQNSGQLNFTKPCASQVQSTPIKISKKIVKPSNVDTSNFTIEERLVAAVWVHERKRTRTSISQIKNEFRQRFGRDPPAKNTLLIWEKKLFSSGSVHDAPRPGRPINRKTHIDKVAASVQSAPTLSLRARAATLIVSHTTLRTILQKDLPNLLTKNRDSTHTKIQTKPQSTRRVRKQIMKKTKPKIAEQAQYIVNPPMTANNDLHIRSHYLPRHNLNANCTT